MVVLEEKVKPGGGLIAGAHVYLEEMKHLKEMQDHNTSKKAIHSELWHACAGPLVTLPQVGSLVYYFPQGHSEQVAVSTNRFNTTSQIQNYPDLPSQLLCQVHNVTFNADKDTDEVFAQMSLQPVNSEKDVLPMPDFGLNRNKHPTEFFCKTLTASDTSTHGGFSVPRRAAEKLFPQLDYSMQPPTQELIVKDLHENTWTFRHIYRGQPKRHLLTTGWSMFVGSKRLRAGDSVLFIRDERSHLMIGVRRENLKKSTLPSSLLSADSMHLGLLAAAAHAAINRSSFSIFYNPRACPSDFVISMEKYRKSLYNTQISPGTRFGRMFETEESTKRRYMGMVVGISDLDPVRWPGSKWRNIQVEWDEPVSGDKHNRISPWEIETPESLFIFSPLTTGLKRPFESTFSGAQTEWENMVHKQFVRVQENVNCGLVSHMPSISQSSLIEPPELINKLVNPIRFDPSEMPASEFARLEPVLQSNQFSQCTDGGLVVKEATSSHDLSSEMRFMNNSNQLLMQMNPNIMQIQLDARFVYPLNDKMPQSQHLSENGIFEYRSTFQSTGFSSVLEKHENPNLFPGCVGPDVSVTEEMWMNQLNNAKCPNANDIYSCLNFDGSNSSSTVVDPSISSTTLDEFSTLKDGDFNNPSDFHLTNFTSSQDVQSQITSASLATDSHGFSFQEFADNSGGASSSNVIDLDESLPMPNTPWKQTAPRIRTYTKIQKAGSVGRSIDVSRFKNYNELCSAIECMFGLEGLLLLNDSKYSGWKLVYVDYENDVLLVGDDPWEGFVRCVRCIRILSPSEVQQMSEEGMQLLNLVSEAGSLLRQ